MSSEIGLEPTISIEYLVAAAKNSGGKYLPNMKCSVRGGWHGTLYVTAEVKTEGREKILKINFSSIGEDYTYQLYLKSGVIIKEGQPNRVIRPRLSSLKENEGYFQDPYAQALYLMYEAVGEIALASYGGERFKKAKRIADYLMRLQIKYQQKIIPKARFKASTEKVVPLKVGVAFPWKGVKSPRIIGDKLIFSGHRGSGHDATSGLTIPFEDIDVTNHDYFVFTMKFLPDSEIQGISFYLELYDREDYDKDPSVRSGESISVSEREKTFKIPLEKGKDTKREVRHLRKFQIMFQGGDRYKEGVYEITNIYLEKE